MKIKLLQIILLAVFLTSISFAQKKSTRALIGNWESESLADSHLTILKINRDSTFLIQNDLAANYTYKLSGNRIIRTLLNTVGGGNVIDTAYYKLKKDSLIITFPEKGKDKIIKMARLKERRRKVTGITGNYTWKYTNGHIAFSKFTKDGKWLFRLPEQIVKGRYDIFEDKIAFHYSDKPGDIEKRMFFIKGKRLLLRDMMSNSQSYYRKIDYFPEEK